MVLAQVVLEILRKTVGGAPPILNRVKFPFQRYIVCWGKIYHWKIIGGVPRATSTFYSVKLCLWFCFQENKFELNWVLTFHKRHCVIESENLKSNIREQPCWHTKGSRSVFPVFHAMKMQYAFAQNIWWLMKSQVMAMVNSLSYYVQPSTSLSLGLPLIMH